MITYIIDKQSSVVISFYVPGFCTPVDRSPALCGIAPLYCISLLSDE